MELTPLNLDTSREIEERQIESWRAMSPARKAAMVTEGARVLEVSDLLERALGEARDAGSR